MEEFRCSFGTDTEVSLRVLQRNLNDITRMYKTGVLNDRPTRTVQNSHVVITEGKTFKCGCDRKEIT